MQKKLFVFFTLFLISSSGWGQLNQNVSDLPNFASLAEKVTPAVVNVSVTKVIKSPAQNEMRRGPFNDPFFDDFFGFVFVLDFFIYAFFNPLGYLETTRLEKLVRLLTARRQTDEYETSYDDF